MPDNVVPLKLEEQRSFPTRLFITGGSGYVGRNLIRHFRSKGSAVVALVRSQAARSVVEELGAVPCMGDLFDDNLAEAMTECDGLIHAAADTNHSYGGPSQFRVNRTGTHAVFAAAKRAGLRAAVHISTESIFATGKPLINIDETHPLPRRYAGSYSRSKAEAERAALAQSEQAFQAMAVRPRFVWGRDDTTALPQLANAVHAGKFAWIDGGDYMTSTTHIDNLCHGVELAFLHGRGGEAYFIADEGCVQFRAFISALLATQGMYPPDKNVPRWLLSVIARVSDALASATSGRLKGPLSYQAYATSAVTVTMSTEKARLELGYKPLMSQEAGLAEMASVLESTIIASSMVERKV